MECPDQHQFAVEVVPPGNSCIYQIGSSSNAHSFVCSFVRYLILLLLSATCACFSLLEERENNLRVLAATAAATTGWPICCQSATWWWYTFLTKSFRGRREREREFQLRSHARFSLLYPFRSVNGPSSSKQRVNDKMLLLTCSISGSKHIVHVRTHTHTYSRLCVGKNEEDVYRAAKPEYSTTF